MAEAILSRAVIVVEGATEAALFPIASEVMEAAPGTDHEHLDLAGVSIFNAGCDKEVPLFGPFFKALGKPAFAFYDKQGAAPDAAIAAKLADYNQVWESPEKGIEAVLVGEMPVAVLRRFLNVAKDRDDYPVDKGVIDDVMDDGAVKVLTKAVLKVRKGDNQPYAALLIAECQDDTELPVSIKSILETVQATLKPPVPEPAEEGQELAAALEAEAVVEAAPDPPEGGEGWTWQSS
jgi:putative ATP-dependent endonuclease of OLD family